MKPLLLETIAQTGFNGNIAALFNHQAQKSPDAIAIVCDRSWTYKDLRERMLEYARGLSTYDLPPETTISVFLPRDGDMVAILLAILWCGYAYVPIDPDDPADRSERIQNAAACKLAVCSPDLPPQRRPFVGSEDLPQSVHLNELIANGQGKSEPACATGGGVLAYVMFTSGSTGEPKGVEIEHRQVLHLLHASQELLGFSQTDRYLAIATIAFDISVVEIFLPLITGGSFLLRDRALLKDPTKLFRDTEENSVSIVQLGPSSWSLLLDADCDIPHLRVAITTGEAIAPALAAHLAEIADAVWNLYGPTETTVWVTGHRLGAQHQQPSSVASEISAPIGMPFPRCLALVVNAENEPVPAGEKGELLIGGPGLARGYRDDPELTQEKFVTRNQDQTRYYRSGDLVSQDKNGLIQYHGRVDDQLSIRGIRIEPREVEKSLLTVPGIVQAAATWFETPAGARGLCSAIVWMPGRSIPFEKLHETLRQKLPAAMIPSRLITLNELPLTANGKVDRNAIRAAATSAASDNVEPGYARSIEMTDTEARLSMIWANTLGASNISLDTHFFTEGGDSLSAIAMMLDVEKAMGAKFDPEILWKAPRLRDFAKLIERARHQPVDLSNTRTVFPIVETGNGAPLFFSNIDRKVGQNGLWQADCPLYAIVQWAHGRGFVKANTIQELAAAQIKEIRKIQPAGPYRLGGYSLGGLIALEIARQLRGQGDKVDLLFLLDPMAPVRFRTATNEEAEKSPGFIRPPLAVRLWQQWGKIRVDPKTEIPETLRKGMEELRRLPLWQSFTYYCLDLYGRHPSSLTRLLVPKNRWPAFWYMSRKLAQAYIAEPYDGPCLAIFHARDQRYNIWRPLLGENAEFSIVESSHLGLFTEPALDKWLTIFSATVKKPIQSKIPAKKTETKT
jgi:L-serine---[L-seryl-carrier protein] ligase